MLESEMRTHNLSLQRRIFSWQEGYILVPAAHGMVRQRPMMGYLTTGCYKVRLSAPTRVATPHLGSEYAHNEPIPWSIDRIS